MEEKLRAGTPAVINALTALKGHARGEHAETHLPLHLSFLATITGSPDRCQYPADTMSNFLSVH